MGSTGKGAEERLEVVDALRGFALLGLLLVHCVEKFELHWIDPQSDFWFESVFAVFAGKSFAIFALLFGFGFATIMANQRGRGVEFTGRFAWRVLLLFAIGTLHALIYRGDILQVLAVMGLLLIPLDRIASNRVLIVLAALLFVQFPLLWRAWEAGQGEAWAQALPFFFGDTGLGFLAHGSFADLLAVNGGPGMWGKWSFYWETGRMVEVAGLFALGMVLQRKGAFADLPGKRRQWAWALLVCGALWAVLGVWGQAVLPAGPQDGGAPMQRQVMDWWLAQWSSLAAMGFQISLFVLLWQTPMRAIQQLFAAPGRMTLTLYVGQSLIAVPLLYGFGAAQWSEHGYGALLAMGIAFFIAQIAFATWWYAHFRYGPLEWVWRAATLTSLRVPMRR